MKFIVPIFFCLLIFENSYCQETKTLSINPLHNNEDELRQQAYQFPHFLEGKIIYKDSAVSFAILNYQRIVGEVHFINPKGDTLSVAHPETFDKIIIGVDTFYYFEKGFVQILTHTPSINLGIKQLLKYIGKEKKGAYGTYSGTASMTSYDSYTADDQTRQAISIDENSLYKYINLFYLADRFYNFFPANKKTFYQLFSHHEKKLKEYLQENKIDFHKKADLQKLLQYLESL